MPATNPEAARVSRRKHYQKHKAEVISAVGRRREENRRKFHAYKAELSCTRCGFSHPAALHFHHRDPQKKEFHAGAKAAQFGQPKFMAELLKCDVLCANCHAILHYDERKPSFDGRDSPSEGE